MFPRLVDFDGYAPVEEEFPLDEEEEYEDEEEFDFPEPVWEEEWWS